MSKQVIEAVKEIKKETKDKGEQHKNKRGKREKKKREEKKQNVNIPIKSLTERDGVNSAMKSHFKMRFDTGKLNRC